MSTRTQDTLPFGNPLSSTPSRPVPRNWLDKLPPGAECLRDYQRVQIAKIATALHAGWLWILVQLATGGGKTHEICAVVQAAKESGLRVLVLAPRTRLITQIHERLEAFGVRHGVIAAPLPHLRNANQSVQLASVDTLYRRGIAVGKMQLPSADVVIFDEAHFASAKTRLKLLDAYPQAVRLGFTATPARKSGRSLSAAFKFLILGPSIRELTAAGVLAPVRIFASPLLTAKDLCSIPKDHDGDFKAGPLGEFLTRPKLIGDVIENWLRIANGKRTLVFAVNKAHGAALLEQFLRQGVPTEMVTDADAEDTREAVIGRLEAGETVVLINCVLLSYGVDMPLVECVVLARPTRSLVTYLQMCGRGRRPDPGKPFCLLIDHGRVVEHLGLPSGDFDWSLDMDKNVNATAAAARNMSRESMRTCPECTAVWLTSEDGPSCPGCGWTPAPRAKAISVEEADLEELACAAGETTPTDPRVERFYREALGWNHKYKPQKWQANGHKVRGACWHAAKEKFKLIDGATIPNRFWRLEPLPCSVEVAGWMKYRAIRWARGRSRGTPA
jgi:DNA repair protein RadD